MAIERNRVDRQIPLHQPFYDDREPAAAAETVASGRVGGHGPCLDRVERSLRDRLGVRHVLATTSATHALEMALMIHGIGPGDEVIVPAYGFPSTAGCVVQRGAAVVFADACSEDPQIDPDDVARRLTPRTRAVIAIHYAGIPCDIEALRQVLHGRNVALIEDAAHAIDARHQGRALGTLADGGCLSFHVTKNVTCGEGGAFLTGDDAAARSAEIARDMGTDRARMLRGEAEHYSWCGRGSSYVPSEVLMAILAVQLGKADEILERRRRLFHRYMVSLDDLGRRGVLRLPRVPAGAEPNGHIFHVLLPDEKSCESVVLELREAGIEAARHYLSLDESPYGRQFLRPGQAGYPRSRDLAARLLRLPIFAAMTEAEQDRVVAALRSSVARL